MTNLAFATVKELRNLLDSKKITATELLDFYRARFEKYDPTIGSALELFDSSSIMATSSPMGSLAGIPGLVKDNIAQKGRTLTCASKILAGYVAPYDATAIERIKQAGGLLMGRANCDEFAMGSSTERSAYQKTYNPWDITRVPGGSSGGSIACVAAGLVPWSLGSDTGGSVRQPAAFCGIVGLMPTYGRVSRYGLVAYGSSLDKISIAVRSVYDGALILSVIAGPDPKDATSLRQELPDFTRLLSGKLKENLVIGVVENALYSDGVEPAIIQAIEQALQEFQKLGATIKKVNLDSLEYANAAYTIISRAEAASNLARFDGVRYGARDTQASTLLAMYNQTRHDGFGDEVRRRILVGNYVLSTGHADAFYANAKKVQTHIRASFQSLFSDVDLLLMPTTPTPAFKCGQMTSSVQMDLQDYFTTPISVAGVPAIAVPCGMTSDNLPLGLQLVGPHCSEALLLQTAHAYEQATPWHTMHPPAYQE